MFWFAFAGLAASGIQGNSAKKAAKGQLARQERMLAVDADRQAKALLEETRALDSARLLAFERDALSQQAEERGRLQALAARGPELSLSRDEEFSRAAKARRRQSFFSQGGSI